MASGDMGSGQQASYSPPSSGTVQSQPGPSSDNRPAWVSIITARQAIASGNPDDPYYTELLGGKTPQEVISAKNEAVLNKVPSNVNLTTSEALLGAQMRYAHSQGLNPAPPPTTAKNEFIWTQNPTGTWSRHPAGEKEELQQEADIAAGRSAAVYTIPASERTRLMGEAQKSDKIALMNVLGRDVTPSEIAQLANQISSAQYKTEHGLSLIQAGNVKEGMAAIGGGTVNIESRVMSGLRSETKAQLPKPSGNSEIFNGIVAGGLHTPQETQSQYETLKTPITGVEIPSGPGIAQEIAADIDMRAWQKSEQWWKEAENKTIIEKAYAKAQGLALVGLGVPVAKFAIGFSGTAGTLLSITSGMAKPEEFLTTGASYSQEMLFAPAEFWAFSKLELGASLVGGKVGITAGKTATTVEKSVISSEGARLGTKTVVLGGLGAATGIKTEGGQISYDVESGAYGAAIMVGLGAAGDRLIKYGAKVGSAIEKVDLKTGEREPSVITRMLTREKTVIKPEAEAMVKAGLVEKEHVSGFKGEVNTLSQAQKESSNMIKFYKQEQGNLAGQIAQAEETKVAQARIGREISNIERMNPNQLEAIAPESALELSQRKTALEAALENKATPANWLGTKNEMEMGKFERLIGKEQEKIGAYQKRIDFLSKSNRISEAQELTERRAFLEQTKVYSPLTGKGIIVQESERAIKMGKGMSIIPTKKILIYKLEGKSQFTLGVEVPTGLPSKPALTGKFAEKQFKILEQEGKYWKGMFETQAEREAGEISALGRAKELRMKTEPERYARLENQLADLEKAKVRTPIKFSPTGKLQTSTSQQAASKISQLQPTRIAQKESLKLQTRQEQKELLRQQTRQTLRQEIRQQLKTPTQLETRTQLKEELKMQTKFQLKLEQKTQYRQQLHMQERTRLIFLTKNAKEKPARTIAKRKSARWKVTSTFRSPLPDLLFSRPSSMAKYGKATQARLSERQVRYIERRSIAGRVPSAEQLRWGN
jgi:hypothetical protein